MTGTITDLGCGVTTLGVGDITQDSKDLGVITHILHTTGEIHFSITTTTHTDHITILGDHTGIAVDTTHTIIMVIHQVIITITDHTNMARSIQPEAESQVRG